MLSIVPLLLIIVSLVGSFFYTKPTYDTLTKDLDRKDVLSKAVSAGQEFEKLQSELVSATQAIPMNDLENLKKLLPGNIDNVRLIIEINEIAKKYTRDSSKGIENVRIADAGKNSSDRNKNSGIMNMAFSVKMPYVEFGNFLRELESNLRVTDVSAISFNAPTTDTKDKDIYTFSVTLKTYWLKDQ